MQKRLQNREYWLDYIKVFACILIVIGHFAQSMVRSQLMPETVTYDWLIKTLYSFHVALFFVCSGYLFQKRTRINSFAEYLTNLRKKAITLGIPYFVFSSATWLLKKVFSGSANMETGGYLDTLFLHPVAPYWFLLILFFIFIITIPLKDKKSGMVRCGAALLLKIIKIYLSGHGIFSIYLVEIFSAYWIWFVLGMMLSLFGMNVFKHKRYVGFALFIVFLIISKVLYPLFSNDFVIFGIGLIAVTAIIMIFVDAKECKLLNTAYQYTMPVFLMNTLFAAPTRAILLKLGIASIPLHTIAGLVIGIIGPVVTMKILEKLQLSWLVFPNP